MMDLCDGDPMDVDDKEEEPLPFPHVVDGKMESRLLDIYKQDKTTLKDWCRGFGLHHSGSKKVLKNELRSFSRDQAAWDRLLPGARHLHRGPRIGSKTTSKKASALHGKPAVPHAHARAILPTQATQLAASQVINSKADLDWAKDVLDRFPHMDKPARDAYRMQAAGRHVDASVLNDSINYGFNEIKAIIKAPPYPSYLPPMLANATPQPPHPSTTYPPPAPLPAYSTPLLQYSADGPTSVKPRDIQEDCQATATTTTSSPKARTLELGSGATLTFTPDDVPFPPAPTFADDLPRLNRMWDDVSAAWDGQSALHIKDVPIAIVYWPIVYASSKVAGPWKSRQWKVLKSRHSEWKYIVRRWREGSEADFWKEFSDLTGTRMNYTAIVSRLKALRAEENDWLAEQAKEEYGDRFASTFVYKKKGRTHVLSKSADIARLYQKLQAEI